MWYGAKATVHIHFKRLNYNYSTVTGPQEDQEPTCEFLRFTELEDDLLTFW